METEFMSIAAPLLEDPMVAGLAQYPHHRGKTRLDHVKEVAELSFRWGKRLSLDCRAMVRGALLHDLFFYDWLHEGPRYRAQECPAVNGINGQRGRYYQKTYVAPHSHTPKIP